MVAGEFDVAAVTGEAFSSTTAGDTAGDADIYTINVDGTNAVNLTNSPANELIASWSPDGEKIAFGSVRDGNWEIYLMNRDGTQQTRLTDHPGFDGDPIWIPSSSSLDLGAFRWKHRLLLVFAPTPNDTAYQNLKQQIHRRQQDFDERDMLLIEVLAEGSSRVGADALSPASATGLREQFGISRAQFSVFLIGKDGGVKLRTEQPSTLAEIFALIDTMPMRRREMQKR